MINAQNNHMDNAESALKFVEETINEFGPRLTGDPSTKNAVKKINDKFEQIVGNSIIEEFVCKPRAFLGFTKVVPILFIIANIFAFLEVIIANVILLSIALVVILCEFIFYWELLDPFYKNKSGYNVISIITPNDQIKKEIIISGHHDVAYEFNLIKKNPKTYVPKAYGGILLLFSSTIISWILLIHWVQGNNIQTLLLVLQILGVIAFPLNIILYGFVSEKGVPGASDNLIASAILIELAKILKKDEEQGQGLQNVQVKLISFDAEEAGLRGARDYVKKHLNELKSVPTEVINLDGLANFKDFGIVTRDLNSIVVHDAQLVEKLLNTSKKLGYSAKKSIIPMGATDAAEFSKKKIVATSIVAMPTDHISEFYHTDGDVTKIIEKEAVDAAISVIYQYIKDNDSE